MKTLLVLLSLSLSAFFCGCSSSASIAKGDIAGATLAGVAGSLIGNVVKEGQTAATIGGGAGVAIYGGYTVKKRTEEQKQVEAYEQGKREARYETGKEFWDEVTDADGSMVRNDLKKKKGSRQTQYEARVENGVRYGTGQGEAEATAEPAVAINGEPTR